MNFILIKKRRDTDLDVPAGLVLDQLPGYVLAARRVFRHRALALPLAVRPVRVERGRGRVGDSRRGDESCQGCSS